MVPREAIASRFSCVVATALVLLLVACRTENPDEENPNSPSTVERVVERLMRADNGGDLATVLDSYTTDAQLFPPDGRTIAGRDAIRAHYVGIFASLSLDLKAKPAETQLGRVWAWQRGEVTGRITTKPDGATSEAHDRYLMILELCDDKRWRVARLLWNPAEQR